MAYGKAVFVAYLKLVVSPGADHECVFPTLTLGFLGIGATCYGSGTYCARPQI